MEEKRGKTISIAWYWIGYKIYLASGGQILKAAMVPVGQPKCHKLLSAAIKHLHDVTLHSFHSHPS